jgi:hypothetical protein
MATRRDFLKQGAAVSITGLLPTSILPSGKQVETAGTHASEWFYVGKA